MNNHSQIFSIIASIALFTAGCGKNRSAGSTASELEKAFQTKAPEPAAATSPNPSPGQAAREDDVRQAVGQAVSAIRTNGYAEAFFTLRAVQASPRLTVDQYSAIENARLAVERDLAAKAAAGDPAALKALETIKKTAH